MKLGSVLYEDGEDGEHDEEVKHAVPPPRTDLPGKKIGGDVLDV